MVGARTPVLLGLLRGLVVALVGCDYVVGLKELRDASVVDGDHDGASDAAIDAPSCTIGGPFDGDDFTGTMIDAQKWTSTGNVVFEQNDQLSISIGAGTTNGVLRAVTLIQETDGVLLDIVRAPQVPETEIALVLETPQNSQLYRFEIEGSGLARITALNETGFTFSYSPSTHRFIGMQHDDAQIVFVTSPDGETLVPVTSKAASLSSGYRVAVHANGSAATASAPIVDDLRVFCR